MKKDSLLRKQFACTVIALTVYLFTAKGQMVSIPDANFRAKLIAHGYGACIVGDSINAACPAVAGASWLDVSYANISDLQGIQAFVSITSLNCSVNQLTYLPVLPNTLTSLDCFYNQLTNLPTLPNALTHLSCYYNRLTTLPALPASLLSLGCDRNLLTSLPALPNLTSLSCSENILTALPSLPSSLAYFNCSHNLLTSLPALPNSLPEVYCSRNQLTSLPALPVTCTRLDCYNNHLTSLPSLPASLSSLTCDSNQLSSFPALPGGLSSISCSYNQISTLPALPVSLIGLSCTNNQLTSLPALPSKLRLLRCDYNNLSILPVLTDTLVELYCSHNQIVSLPLLPDTLDYLDCSYNQLISLPALPDSLHEFYCSNNQLSMLPSLPEHLYTLRCDDNLLISIPSLPRFLTTLSCTNNLITYLPELPDTMFSLQCYDNPNLHCLPQLKTITLLDFQGCPITCLPNYGNIDLSLPSQSTLPLCDIFNPNGCNVFWNISGRSFFDANANCTYETGDSGQAHTHIKLFRNGILDQQVFTGAEGLYSFLLSDTGNYQVQIDTANLAFNVTCPSPSIYNDTITAADSVFYHNDFALYCKSGFDAGIWTINGMDFRPGHQTTLHIYAGDMANFYGARCANGVSATVLVILQGPISYVGPAPGALLPTSIIGDSLFYNIPDLGTIGLFSAFNIIVRTDTLALAGMQACANVSISLAPGDTDPANNFLSHCFTIRSSYDPNEKTVFPEGYVSGNDWLTYTIHFQNTGTSVAENIFILDTLDANLDASTFQLLFTSHPSMVQILEGGIARFNFPNINLPDSNSNEPLSHGSVQYKIKITDNTPPGSQITNTASIYFDFNAPVRTNAAHNTLCQSSHLNLNASICNGEIYIFNGQILTQNGTYTDSLSGSNGCDSIVTLQLNVHAVDTSIIFTNDSLTALSSSASYQWMDCISGTIVPGANGPVFRPTMNGSYALIATDNNCTDTSVCYQIVLTSISELESAKIVISPNPFHTDFALYFPGFSSDFVKKIMVTDLLGNEIPVARPSHSYNIFSMEYVPDGMYFLRIETVSGVFVKKLIKQ